MIKALQHFEVYVGGASLGVYTDHNPLKFLKSLQCPNCKVLQSYDLDIRHIKGTVNIIAKVLSHAPLNALFDLIFVPFFCLDFPFTLNLLLRYRGC